VSEIFTDRKIDQKMIHSVQFFIIMYYARVLSQIVSIPSRCPTWCWGVITGKE